MSKEIWERSKVIGINSPKGPCKLSDTCIVRRSVEHNDDLTPLAMMIIGILKNGESFHAIHGIKSRHVKEVLKRWALVEHRLQQIYVEAKENERLEKDAWPDTAIL